MTKNLEYYLQLPYRVVLYPSDQGEYAAEVPDLPGCISQGQSVAEVYKMIELNATRLSLNLSSTPWGCGH